MLPGRDKADGLALTMTRLSMGCQVNGPGHRHECASPPPRAAVPASQIDPICAAHRMGPGRPHRHPDNGGTVRIGRDEH